jgi:hypothetical protein
VEEWEQVRPTDDQAHYKQNCEMATVHGVQEFGLAAILATFSDFI